MGVDFKFIMQSVPTILVGAGVLGMFTQLNVSMPLPTKILVTTVDFVKVYWPLIILFFIALPIIYKLAYNTDTGKRTIDTSILKIPL